MIKDNGQRRHIRVRDDIPVYWQIDQLGLSGRGILRNLSLSGAMLETKALINGEAGPLVTLQAVELSEASFVPPMARMIWGRAVGEGKGYYFYGLEFQRPGDKYLKAIESRVDEKTRLSSFGLWSGIADTTWTGQ